MMGVWAGKWNEGRKERRKEGMNEWMDGGMKEWHAAQLHFIFPYLGVGGGWIIVWPTSSYISSPPPWSGSLITNHIKDLFSNSGYTAELHPSRVNSNIKAFTYYILHKLFQARKKPLIHNFIVSGNGILGKLTKHFGHKKRSNHYLLIC